MVLLVLGQLQFIEVEDHLLMQQELDSQAMKLQEQEFEVVRLVQKELEQVVFLSAKPIEQVMFFKVDQALSQFTLIFVAEQVPEQFLKVELQLL